MAHFNFDQAGLSDALGVSLSRVKRLSSGRAEKFSTDELKKLIEMGVSANWLGTGTGPMLQSETEQVLNRRLTAVDDTTKLAASLDLPIDKQLLLRDILYAAEIGDYKMISEALAGYTAIRPDQAALLDNLEHCAKEDQDAIKRMALLAAHADPNETQPGKKKQMKKTG